MGTTWYKPGTLMAVMALSTQLLPAHGRNTTAVRADIERDGGEIRIQAVVLDLLEVGNVNLADWNRLEWDSRKALLRECGMSMSRRFGLLTEEAGLLYPESVRVEVPDLEEGRQRSMTIDQQIIGICLRYDFACPPSGLIFAQEFRGGQPGESIPAQLLVYQSGELVLLPAQFGPGLPLLHRFNWQAPPADISKMSSLDGVVPDWRHRPASLRLVRDGSGLLARAYLPLNGVQVAGAAAAPELLSSLAPWLGAMIRLRSGPVETDLSGAEYHRYPYSVLAVEHQEALPGETSDSGLLVLEKAIPEIDPVMPMEALLGPESGPLALLLVVEENENEVTFSLLNTIRPDLARSSDK